MAEKIYDVVVIKKLVAAKLKKEFPKFAFSITTRRGGRGKLYINWYRGNINPFTDANTTYVNLNHFYIKDEKRITQKAQEVMQRVKQITDEYNWDNSDMMTDYIDVNFYLDLYVGTSDKPFEVVGAGSKPSSSGGAATDSSTSAVNFDKGNLLRSDAGWSAYKKTLPDGRIVYNVFKEKETAANKDDWNVIKGEVYVESGFKWSKYGFSKWGSLSNENRTLDALFDVLKKYYQSNQPTTQSSTINNITPEIIKNFKEYVSSFYGANGIYANNYQGGFSNLEIENAVDTYILTTDNWGGGDTLDRENVLDILVSKDKFVYGEKYGVPKNDGQEIIVELERRGFNIIENSNEIIISKLGYNTMSVYDNGGEFSLTLENNSTFFRSIPYDKISGIESPNILAIFIEDVYFNDIIFSHNASSNDAEKQEIQEAITALKYLADAGDEDAKNAITALQYLL
jgi:hypothetical protein